MYPAARSEEKGGDKLSYTEKHFKAYFFCVSRLSSLDGNVVGVDRSNVLGGIQVRLVGGQHSGGPAHVRDGGHARATEGRQLVRGHGTRWLVDTMVDHVGDGG